MYASLARVRFRDPRQERNHGQEEEGGNEEAGTSGGSKSTYEVGDDEDMSEE